MKKPAFNLILATSADVAEVASTLWSVHLWLKSKGISQWADPFTEKQLQTEIAANSLYVLHLEGWIAASVLLARQDEIWEDHAESALYISRLAIDRKFGGQSLGPRIIQWAEHEAKNRKLKSIRLTCDQTNVFLNQYYERLGFKKTGVREYSPYAMTFTMFEKPI